MLRILCAMVVVASGTLLGMRCAQGAQVPPAAEPSILMRSLETPLRRQEKKDVFVANPAAQAQAKGDTRKMFTLKGVVLDGSSIYDKAAVDALCAPEVGRPVSFADIEWIAQTLTRRYRADGYVFSRVIVPPQKIKNGIVRFKAIEGRVSEVQLQGAFDDKNGLLHALADKIRSAAPANIKDIERYLLLMNDVPGIFARAFMKPSKTPYGGMLIIAVEEKKMQGTAAFGNRGSRYSGPWRAGARVVLNDMLGLHDSTALRGDFATQLRELKYGEITHEEQIGTQGLRLTARYAVTQTQPGGALGTLGVEGDSTLFDVALAYPFLRSRAANVTMLAGAQMNDSTTELTGATVAQDRIRTVRVGMHADAADAWRGQSALDMTLTQGLGVLGATADGTGRSRANAKRETPVWQLSASRVQGLPVENVSAAFFMTGQYASAPLLAAEEFTLGGENFGRAYDAGELAGDRGYAGAFELRYDGRVQGAWLHGYQSYVFADYGRTYNIAPVVGEVKRDSLSSAGLGLRYWAAQGISGYAELAIPLNKKVNAQGNTAPRFFINMQKQF